MPVLLDPTRSEHRRRKRCRRRDFAAPVVRALLQRPQCSGVTERVRLGVPSRNGTRTSPRPLTNGLFTEAEKMQALDIVLDRFGGKVPVMFGVGSMTTAEAVRLAKYAEKAGADALLAVPLNYWPLTERELEAHFSVVSESSGVPLWLYNNPALVGFDMKPEFIARLASLPTLVGMRDSSGDLTRVFRIPEMTNQKVMVGAGQDTLILEIAAGPSPARFSGLANVAPAMCASFWNAAKEGEIVKAHVLSRKLLALAELGSRFGIVRVAHEAGQILDLKTGHARRPLLPPDASAHKELRTALSAAELL